MTTDQSVMPALNKPLSAVGPLLVLLLIGCFVFVRCGGDEPNPNNAAHAIAGTHPSAVAVAPSQTSDAETPPKNVPLMPPPNNACVGVWCGKRLGYASIIVDYGYRKTNLPKRAWVVAVATAMQESSLKNQSSDKYKVTEQFPFDKVGSDHDSVGLFQQRPDKGWGTPEELMDPHIAAERFYRKLAKRVKNWKNWQDPGKVKLYEIAQAVQISAYPQKYQKHEADAIKIVNLVLQYPFRGNKGSSATHNKWFVMFQCGNPKAKRCRAIPWELVQPVVMNHNVFKAAFPKAELNDHLGNAPHQNNDPPQDHTPGSESCYGGTCNKLGWVYAQDFGNGKATGTGFDINHFVRWLLGELRANPKKYKEIKYIISTIPGNKGTPYYGLFHRENDWRPTETNRDDHAGHVHLSYMPGYERAESTIIADYIKSGGVNIKPAAAPNTGAAAGFRHFMD